MPRRSRYSEVGAFAADPLGRMTFRGLLPRPIGTPEGRIEHTVKAGERLDRLALGYFNQDRDWWRVADANPGFTCATDMLLDGERRDDDPLGRDATVGQTIVIPVRED